MGALAKIGITNNMNYENFKLKTDEHGITWVGIDVAGGDIVGVSGGVFSGANEPSIRSWGAEPVVM